MYYVQGGIGIDDVTTKLKLPYKVVLSCQQVQGALRDLACKKVICVSGCALNASCHFSMSHLYREIEVWGLFHKLFWNIPLINILKLLENNKILNMHNLKAIRFPNFKAII